MNTLLNEYLSRLELGEPQQHGNMLIAPLFSDGDQTPDYLTMTEALEQKLALLTEVGPAGQVPHITVVNAAAQLLLLIEGEELLGARQNRTLNTSVLVPAKSRLVLPVSCTEHGRWAHKSAAFADAGFVSPHKLRKSKSDSVRSFLAMDGSFHSNQPKVWEEVEGLCACLATRSPTKAMSDAMAAKRRELEEYLNGLKQLPNQVGVVVLLNGEVAGCDVVSSTRAYQVLHPKLIRSYALEALLGGEPVAANGWRDKVLAFFDACRAGTETVYPGVGRGEDYRFESPTVAGAALVAEGKVFHLNAYRR
jgi:hypothetical protein